MSQSPAALLDALDRAETPDQRRDIASALAKRSEDDPTCFRDHVDALVSALEYDDTTVRVKVSYVLFAIAEADREAVSSVAPDLISFLYDHDLAAAVRLNLAFPIGCACAEEPAKFDRHHVHMFAPQPVDENKHVRHSVAWGIEKVAFHAPGAALPSIRMLDDGLEDEYQPVQKHACRAYAHMTRYLRTLGEPFGIDWQYLLDENVSNLEAVPQRLLDGFGHGSDAVRSATATLLGALGTDRARNALREQYAAESAPDVRADIEHALREATYPAARDDGGTTLDSVSELEVGDWVDVQVDSRHECFSHVPRSGGYRGRVTAVTITDDEADGTKSPDSERLLHGSQRLDLRNRFEGYTLSLSARDGGVDVVYSDRRQSDPMTFDLDSLERRDPDVVSLLYAIEGDRLRCSLDHGNYEGEVTTASVTDDTYTVRVADDQGHIVVFEPCGHHPTIARFEAGRAFAASDVEILDTSGDEEARDA